MSTSPPETTTTTTLGLCSHAHRIRSSWPLGRAKVLSLFSFSDFLSKPTATITALAFSIAVIFDLGLERYVHGYLFPSAERPPAIVTLFSSKQLTSPLPPPQGIISASGPISTVTFLLPDFKGRTPLFFTRTGASRERSRAAWLEKGLFSETDSSFAGRSKRPNAMRVWRIRCTFTSIILSVMTPLSSIVFSSSKRRV